MNEEKTCNIDESRYSLTVFIRNAFVKCFSPSQVVEFHERFDSVNVYEK